jgi:hypothetical protein
MIEKQVPVDLKSLDGPCRTGSIPVSGTTESTLPILPQKAPGFNYVEGQSITAYVSIYQECRLAMHLTLSCYK